MSTINGATKIADVMTALPYTILSNEPLEAAKRIMYEKEIRHLPVIDSDKVIGLLSDRDMKLAFGVGKGLVEASELLVEDACIFEPYAVEPETPLSEVLKTMLDKHIGSTLVVDGGLPAGIFTLHDAVRLFHESLE